MNAYNQSIALIIPLIVKNNAGRVAIALRDAGYSKQYIPDGELEARLFQLHTANPEKFFQLLSTIPWNYGEKETNSPAMREKLVALTGSSDTNANRGEWWKSLLNMIMGMGQQPAPAPPAPVNNTGMLWVLAVVAIGVIIGLIFLIKK